MSGISTPASEETIQIAEEVFIYGVPLIMNYAIMHDAAIDKNSGRFTAPLNQVARARRLLTPDHSLVVTPNSDTPYSSIWLDLRAEPIVISVPKIENGRYYSCMLCDANTYNFGCFGTRTTGNEAGAFLVSGPDWKAVGAIKGIKKFYRSGAYFALALFRTELFHADDMPNVIDIQNGYQVRTLSAYLGQRPPPPPPRIDFPPIDKETVQKNPREYFEYLDFLMPFLSTTDPKELEMRRKLKKIVQLAPTQTETIKIGMAKGEEKLKNATKGLTGSRNGWRVSSGGGDRAFYNGNWLKRALLARAGIYFIDSEEAVYLATRVDSDGQQLNGRSNKYTLTFSGDNFPPVKSFWSITMYDGERQFMVKNPINRYLINSPMMPSLVKNPDGGVTIYIQKERPGEGMVPNWLPAPDGPIYLVMRLFWPKFPEVDSWRPPTIVRSTTNFKSVL